MKPSIIVNYDYELYPYSHRRNHSIPFFLQQSLDEFFTVYECGQKKPNEVECVLNMNPLVEKGGSGNDIFLQGKITMLWDRTPFEYLQKHYYDRCDWIFTQSPSYLKHYPKEKSSLLMEACNPDDMPYIPQQPTYDIIFMGNPTGDIRPKFKEELSKHFKYLHFSEGDLTIPAATILSQGKLALSILDAQWEGKPAIEYRLFQYGLIRPTLIHYNDDYLEIGLPHAHYIPYLNISDLITIAKYYLEHEDEREDLFQMQRQNLLENHTWQKRAEQIYQTFLKL